MRLLKFFQSYSRKIDRTFSRKLCRTANRRKNPLLCNATYLLSCAFFGSLASNNKSQWGQWFPASNSDCVLRRGTACWSQCGSRVGRLLNEAAGGSAETWARSPPSTLLPPRETGCHRQGKTNAFFDSACGSDKGGVEGGAPELTRDGGSRIEGDNTGRGNEGPRCRAWLMQLAAAPTGQVVVSRGGAV